MGIISVNPTEKRKAIADRHPGIDRVLTALTDEALTACTTSRDEPLTAKIKRSLLTVDYLCQSTVAKKTRHSQRTDEAAHGCRGQVASPQLPQSSAKFDSFRGPYRTVVIMSTLYTMMRTE